MCILKPQIKYFYMHSTHFILEIETLLLEFETTSSQNEFSAEHGSHETVGLQWAARGKCVAKSLLILHNET